MAEARAITAQQRFADLDELTRGCAAWPADPAWEAALPEVRERWVRLKTTRSPDA